jgi:hypothetical protein
MSDSVSLELIRGILRAIQADQRTIRGENELIRKEIGRTATRDELLEVLRVSADRLAGMEGRTEVRFGQLERSVNERLERLEKLRAGRGR